MIDKNSRESKPNIWQCMTQACAQCCLCMVFFLINHAQDSLGFVCTVMCGGAPFEEHQYPEQSSGISLSQERCVPRIVHCLRSFPSTEPYHSRTQFFSTDAQIVNATIPRLPAYVRYRIVFRCHNSRARHRGDMFVTPNCLWFPRPFVYGLGPVAS